MSQLKMYWFPGTPIKEYEFPEGYSVSNYSKSSDREDWVKICENGLAGNGEYGYRDFASSIAACKDIDLEKDVFFLDYNGEHIGTVTAFVHSNDNTGDVHMVSIRTDFRGKGLGKYLNMIALKHLSQKDIRFAHLTTDEWRKGAVKSYLNAGFKPVEYDIGMEERWAAVLEEYNIDSVDMVYEDGSFYKTINRASKMTPVKFGVLGAGRGTVMMDYCKKIGNATLVAICDKSEALLDKRREDIGTEGIEYFTDYDEFLKVDMDVVVLANYATEHAPFAIKALNSGKNVMSESLPCKTMEEAIELIETVEKTGLIYSYAENCCFMEAPKRMREMFRNGEIGKFEYGEGEYVHNCEPNWSVITNGGDKNHWRNQMDAFYYCTHSIGPIMHIAGQRPVSVTGFEIPHDDRMERMGTPAGAGAVEIITLESGAIIKSLHGLGLARNSIWYSVYGSKGRLESARKDDTAHNEYNTLYADVDEFEGQNASKPHIENTDDDLYNIASAFAHGGCDFYIMYNMVQRVRGNKNADTIDVYEAFDMFLPGYFAHLSSLEGGKPMRIPNLRNKEERELYKKQNGEK